MALPILRNIHPTTSLMLPFIPTGSASSRGAYSLLPPGVLVFSSRSLVLLSCPTEAALPPAVGLIPEDAPSNSRPHTLGSAAIAAAAAAVAGFSGRGAGSGDTAVEQSLLSGSPSPFRRRILRWALPGIPTCAEWITPGEMLVLGDSMAGGFVIGSKRRGDSMAGGFRHREQEGRGLHGRWALS